VSPWKNDNDSTIPTALKKIVFEGLNKKREKKKRNNSSNKLKYYGHLRNLSFEFYSYLELTNINSIC
jgi:hypothetical protein